MCFSDYIYFSWLHSSFLSQDCDSLYFYNKTLKLLLVFASYLYHKKHKRIKEVLKMSEKQMKVLGWVATLMSVMMYVSYFPQIMNNLAGQKGNFIQPLVAAINCSLWVYYGLFKKEIFRLLLPMHQVSFLALWRLLQLWLDFLRNKNMIQ